MRDPESVSLTSFTRGECKSFFIFNITCFFLTLQYSRIFLGFPELALTVVGSIWAFNVDLKCSQPEITVYIVRAMVILHWMLVFFFIVGVCMVFDPLGHHHHFIASSRSSMAVGQENHHHQNHAEIAFKRSRFWEWRCKILCCSCCTGKNPVVS